jgi:hypothetical protein
MMMIRRPILTSAVGPMEEDFVDSAAVVAAAALDMCCSYCRRTKTRP